MKKLLTARADLIALFSPEELHEFFRRDRCFVLIRKNTVALSSFNSGRVPVKYQDYFSEGLPVHPTTCPQGHHFELSSARRYASRMGRICPLSPEHSIGELVENQALREELLQAVPDLDELAPCPKPLVSLIQKVWSKVKEWIERFWRTVRRLLCPDSPPPVPVAGDKEVGRLLETPLELFTAARSILPGAEAAVGVDGDSSISLSLTVPHLRHPIVFHSAVEESSFRFGLERLEQKILTAYLERTVVEEPFDPAPFFVAGRRLQDWQTFRRKEYERQTKEPCQQLLARYLTTQSSEALDALRFLGLAPEQIDRGDISEGDLNDLLLAMDWLELLSSFERRRVEATLEESFPHIARKAWIERVRREFKTLRDGKKNVWLNRSIPGSQN